MPLHVPKASKVGLHCKSMLPPQQKVFESYRSRALLEASEEVVAFDRLRRSFECVGVLSDAELDLVRDIARDVQYHPENKILWAIGAPPPLARILVGGWACRYQMTSTGERQIMHLLLPGDFLTPLLEPRLASSCGVVALTALETVSAKSLADAVKADSGYPTLARVAVHAAHLQEVMLCEQIIRLTRQSADQRFVHLMLELRSRLSRPGLASEHDFALPLIQETLANVLGLSTVHLNRTLQRLRKTGILKFARGVVTLMQPDQNQTSTKNQTQRTYPSAS